MGMLNELYTIFDPLSLSLSLSLYVSLSLPLYMSLIPSLLTGYGNVERTLHHLQRSDSVARSLYVSLSLPLYIPDTLSPTGDGDVERTLHHLRRTRRETRRLQGHFSLPLSSHKLCLLMMCTTRPGQQLENSYSTETVNHTPYTIDLEPSIPTRGGGNRVRLPPQP